LLVEVALLQRFSLLLGDPVLTLVVTLGALLLGGGLGSLFSRQFGDTHLLRLIALAAVLLGLAVLASNFVYPALVRTALPSALFTRIAVAVLALLPLGFLMGIPFPGGLRLAGEADLDGIPLFWGMNAVASTLGGALAVALALSAGFQVALLTGAGIYVLVRLLIHVAGRRVISYEQEPSPVS
jgi:predicted membrane-bound spermidine synthase